MKNIKAVNTQITDLKNKSKQAQARLKKERQAFEKKMNEMNEANKKTLE